MPKNILLVEDEAIIALGQKAKLEKRGYNVKTVSSGEDAIKEAINYDLILMDIDLGRGMSGTEAARVIIDNFEVPVVFLSNHTEKTVIDEVKKVTNYGYVVKNSGEFVLSESVEMAFNLFEARQKEADNFKSLFYNTRIAILIIDPTSGSIVDANHCAEDFYGWNIDELKKMNISEINIMNEDEIKAEMALAKKNKRNYFNFFHKTKSGKIKNVELHSSPVILNNKKYLYSIIQDATEKDVATRKYEDLIERMNEGVAVYEPINDGEDFVFKDINFAGEKLSNVKKEDVVGKTVREVFPYIADESFNLFSTFQEVYKTGKTKQHPISYYQDDRVSEWVENTVYKLDTGEIVAIYADVTKEKQAEDLLKKSEENLRIILDSIGDAVVGVNINKIIMKVNPVAEKLIGRKEEDCIGKHIDEIFHIVNAQTLEKAINPIDNVLKTGEIQYLDNHTKLISKDGKEYYIADSAAPIKNANDEIVGVVFVFRDVSEQYEKNERMKLNEKNLFIFRERLEAVMRAGDIAWWELDLKTGDVLFNEQKAVMIGYKHEDFHTYHDFTKLVHPEDHELAMQAMRDLMTGKKDVYDVEYRIKHKDGHYIWFHDIGKAVEWDDELKASKVTGVVINTTESKEREGELQSLIEEKEDLMEELNHRVKNNLTIIKSFVELKSMTSDVDLSDIASQIQSVVILHEKLYETGSTNSLNFKNYIESLIYSIFSMLYSKEVEINLDVPDDVIFNTKKTVNVGLIINELATNAMKHGFNGIKEKPVFNVKLKRNNGHFALKISNTGNKFPDNFDISQSTSLGLKIIQSLAEQMDGEVKIDTEPITTFTITFDKDAD